MAAPVPYFEVVHQMKNAFNYHLRLVTHARQHGIKAAARAFRTTVPTACASGSGAMRRKA